MFILLVFFKVSANIVDSMMIDLMIIAVKKFMFMLALLGKFIGHKHTNEIHKTFINTNFFYS
jgi:hypothetical protein